MASPRSSERRAAAASADAKVPRAAPATASNPATRATSGLTQGLKAPVDWAVYVVVLMLALAPAVGVPSEEVVQDTLKSALMALGTLLAALCFVWQRRQQGAVLDWHLSLAWPALLGAYALGSMAWSHTYLAAVEAVRWAVLGLLMGLSLQLFSPARLPRLAWALHAGVSVASLWAACQFWFELNWFPQGPNPASTFVNRNFFAELAVCVWPFSLWALSRLRSSSTRALMVASLAFNATALFMTGTRSALTAWLLMACILPVLIHRWRAEWGQGRWSRLAVAGCLGGGLALFLALASLPTGNARIMAESGQGASALQRSLSRVVSVARPAEYTDGSFSVRVLMWGSALRAIADRPLSGVGAGAWEVHIPLYQPPGSQIETDYYVHNEFLQLLAEYGLVGWLAAALLLATLARAAWVTWQVGESPHPEVRQEQALRLIALSSLGALMLVSLAGFPWRMACTGALLALGLGLLAGSDLRLARLGWGPRSSPWWRPDALRLSPRVAWVAACTLLAALALGAWITRQAMVAESRLVQSIKLAMWVARLPNPQDPRVAEDRAEVLRLVREGVAINPHYRKLTPMVADEVALWGDWASAIWIWESVAESRPHVPVLLLNIARAHLRLKQLDQAEQYYERARRLQPQSVSVHGTEIMLLSERGHLDEAAKRLRRYLQAGEHELEMVNGAYDLGQRLGQWDLALQGTELRLKHFPEYQADSWYKLGRLYSQPGPHQDEAKALQAYRAALANLPPPQQTLLRAQVPSPYRERLLP
ncbi:O-antigen ligase family protein [Curvibacter sp. HBC61]|uniref:O-antigen ligase family protein n=1 Tax=Curvibacter cyanobacteriorum TaxID=3026422 RepID=A0ABT5MUL7_9BURK|nr:O-antigen ligase family protein [Curvibacter sp. HBC61]MDD0837527.1 O-antigen ligase family protein [Curvibacter sp. HBC61]